MPSKYKKRKPGFHHGNAKLLDNDVKNIIHAITIEGKTHAEAVANYGISKHTVNAIMRGDTWKHIPRPNPELRKSKPCDNNKKLTKESVIKILTLIKNGKTNSQICNIVNTSDGMVRLIKKGLVHKIIIREFEKLESK